MKPTEIRELTNQEIVERIETFESQLMKLRMNHTVSPLDNPTQITKTRRTIARMKTILSERKAQQNQ